MLTSAFMNAPTRCGLPTGALFRSGAQWSVFTVAADGRARQTNVTVGRRTATFTEVLDGLRESDRVVLYPSDSVRDGVRVAPLPAAR